MGNSQFQPARGHNAATGVFSRGYVENKGDILAPQVGFEPTTLRLTAERLMASSRCKHKTYTRNKRILSDFGGSLGVLPKTLPRWPGHSCRVQTKGIAVAPRLAASNAHEDARFQPQILECHRGSRSYRLGFSASEQRHMRTRKGRSVFRGTKTKKTSKTLDGCRPLFHTGRALRRFT